MFKPNAEASITAFLLK